MTFLIVYRKQSWQTDLWPKNTDFKWPQHPFTQNPKLHTIINKAQDWNIKNVELSHCHSVSHKMGMYKPKVECGMMMWHELHTPYFFSHILIFLDNIDRKRSKILPYVSWWRRLTKKQYRCQSSDGLQLWKRRELGDWRGKTSNQKIKNHKSDCNPKEGKKILGHWNGADCKGQLMRVSRWMKRATKINTSRWWTITKLAMPFLSQCISRQLVNGIILGGSKQQKPNTEKVEAPTKWRMLQIGRHSRVTFRSTVKKGR